MSSAAPDGQLRAEDVSFAYVGAARAALRGTAQLDGAALVSTAARAQVQWRIIAAKTLADYHKPKSS